MKGKLPWLTIPAGVMQRLPLIDKGDHHELRSAIEAFMNYWGFTPNQRQKWDQTLWEDVFNRKDEDLSPIPPCKMFLASLIRYSTLAWLEQDLANRPDELARTWPSVEKAIDDVTQALKGPARILAKDFGGNEIKAYVEGVLYLNDRLKQNPNATDKEVWEIAVESKELVHAKEKAASMGALGGRDGRGPLEVAMSRALTGDYKKGAKRTLEINGEKVMEPDSTERFAEFCRLKWHPDNGGKSEKEICQDIARAEIRKIPDDKAKDREWGSFDSRVKRILDGIKQTKKQRKKAGLWPFLAPNELTST
jgi:hypothetical protein